MMINGGYSRDGVGGNRLGMGDQRWLAYAASESRGCPAAGHPSPVARLWPAGCGPDRFRKRKDTDTRKGGNAMENAAHERTYDITIIRPEMR